MAEDLELELGDENINRTEKRIKDLSSKVEVTSQERDEARTTAEKATELASKAEKERDFYKEFSTLSSKYPNANEFQDKIMEKVKAGYTPEDATVSVLNSEGQLSPIAQAPTQVRREPAAGGSSATVIPSGDRHVEDMTQAERREALLKANDSGELAQVIKNWGRG